MKLYFNKVICQTRKGDNKVRKTIQNEARPKFLPLTPVIIAAKLWNFKNKIQNQLLVTSGEELIPLNKRWKFDKFIYFLIMHTYISNTSTMLRRNPSYRKIFSNWITILGNFYILSTMPSLLIPVDTTKTCLRSFHLRKPD